MEIREFCNQHRNEDAHTEYVAQLALQLFDAVRTVLRLPVRDRVLLEAAALLHDVGYASAPERHMERSVELVREANWTCFRPSQVAYITAIMALHQKRGPLVADAPSALTDLAFPLRAARLGAILRIADGLDQSHIQDARMMAIETEVNPIVVRVSAPVSPQNVEAANGRANLWREVFAVGIECVPTAKKRSNRLPHLQKSDHPLEYFRRHAYRSLKIIRENEAGAIAGGDSKPLHDVRVHIRRLRTLLQVFRQSLRATQAEALRQRLGEIGAALSPARDADVWLDRLRDWLKDAAVHSQEREALSAYYETQKQAAQKAQDPVCALLQSPAYGALMSDCTYFLRIDVPDQIRQHPGGRVDRYGAKILQRRVKKLRRNVCQFETVSGEKGHAIRKQVRRARYVAECFAPVLGKPVQELGRMLKQTADALGRVRDAELSLAHVKQDPSAPAPLQKWIAKEHKKAAADAEQALRMLRRAVKKPPC